MNKRFEFELPPEQSAAEDAWVTKQRERMCRFTIDLPESVHTKFKIACAARRVRMADVVRESIERFYAEQ